MSAQITESPDQQALARTLSTVDRLGLRDNLVELDAQGYTTIRGVLSEDQVDRAKQALLNRVEDNTGKRIDIDTTTSEDFQSTMGTSMDYLPYMLYDDVVFEEILMAEKPSLSSVTSWARAACCPALAAISRPLARLE